MLCGGALSVSLASASSASAATRYATPDGTGPAASCPVSDPCSLGDAVEAPAVSSGDLILVASGDYLLADPLEIDDDVSVGGSPLQPPVITATTPGAAAVELDASDGELHDVAIVQLSAEPALSVAAGTADRINASSEGPATCELGASGGADPLLRDSVCRSGPGASGASAVSISQTGAGSRAAVLRNVTTWSGGAGGVGISASATGGGSAELDARNVIAFGAAADAAADAGSSSTARVNLASSNFDQVDETGAGTAQVTAAGSAGNQVAEPRFEDADAGLLDQRPDSPTVDAGSAGTLLGPFDIHGRPRVQGGAIDIGADEHDGTPPRTSIESGPPQAVSVGKVTFTFQADDPNATFECRTDDDPWVSCSSPYTTGSLVQGDHVFRVRGIDEAGNVESTPAERYFTVDKVVAGANASAKLRQRVGGRSVSLAVNVRAAELARVSATGVVRAGKRRLRFRSRQTTLTAGVVRKLILKPVKRDSARRIAKALRGGKNVEAAIKVTFTDTLGNTATTGNVKVRVRAR